MRLFAATTASCMLLLTAALPSLLLPLAACGQGPSELLLPERNCTTMCGDMVVPYPFGTTAGCYLPGFNLTCNKSQSPPRLSLGDGTLQVVSISLENSTMRVVGPKIPMVVPVGNDTMAIGTWGGLGWGISDEGPYKLAEVYNELVLFGCPFLAFLKIPQDPPMGDLVINTCSTMCSINHGHDCWEQPNSRRCQKCSGLDCCQVSIPSGEVSYNVHLKSLLYTGGIDRPHSVFISEEGWFHPYNASGRSASAIPVVLGWAIISNALPNESSDGNATCPKDLGSTACHSSYSTCWNTGHLYGKNKTKSYTCSCWDGYQGNPYLTDGCQDEP
nr:unnamed protein product [Digitaria exilis]